MVDLFQGLPHLVLAGFDGVHLSHQVVFWVVIHQIDPFPEMGFPRFVCDLLRAQVRGRLTARSAVNSSLGSKTTHLDSI